MTISTYQVLYTRPGYYDGSEVQQADLRKSVDDFIRTHCGPRSGVVGIKVSFSTGFFLVFADSELHACGLPLNLDGLERFWDSLELQLEDVDAQGPMYYDSRSARAAA